jgi:hypothetical protein
MTVAFFKMKQAITNPIPTAWYFAREALSS